MTDETIRDVARSDHRVATIAALREYLWLRRRGKPADVDAIVESRVPVVGRIDARRSILDTDAYINDRVAGGETVREACDRSLWRMLGGTKAWVDVAHDLGTVVSTWLTRGATT